MTLNSLSISNLLSTNSSAAASQLLSIIAEEDHTTDDSHTVSGSHTFNRVSSSNSSSESDEEMISFLIECLETGNTSTVIDSLNQLKLLSKGHEKKKIMIGCRSGCSVLLDMITDDDVMVRNYSVRLLRSITVVDVVQDVVVAEGGMTILMDVLECSTDLIMQIDVVSVLWNLSVKDENKKYLVDCGIVPILIETIKSNEFKLQCQAIGCLTNLSLLERNKEIIGKNEIIPILVNLLEASKNKLKYGTCLLLFNLVTDHARNLKRLEKCNGFDELNKALEEFNIEPIAYEITVDSSRLVSSRKINESMIKWKYLVLEEILSRSDSSTVYTGSYFGSQVAIKITDAVSGKNKDDAENETDMLKRIRHPNIALLMASGYDKQRRVVLILELATKGVLKDIIHNTKTTFTRLKYAHQIAVGINWLHAHNIIHRDLHLNNILVSEDGSIKIADFKSSVIATDQTYTSFKGSIVHSAPEILKVKYETKGDNYPYSKKVDIYSYGLILFEIIHKSPIFDETEDPKLIAKSILNGNRPLFPVELPLSVTNIIDSLWHQNPKKRISIAQLLEQFDSIYTDLLCNERNGLSIINRLWGIDRKDNMIPYSIFQAVLLENIDANYGDLKQIYLDQFRLLICDSKDLVSFQSFCNMVSWFGPLNSLNEYLKRMRCLTSKPFFHGFITSMKAKEGLLHRLDGKYSYFLYRFHSVGGYFVLHVLSKKGRLRKLKFKRNSDGSLLDQEHDLQFRNFSLLHKHYTAQLKLQKHIIGNPFLRV